MNLNLLPSFCSLESWLREHPTVKRRLRKLIVLGVVTGSLAMGTLYFAARWQPTFYVPAIDVAHVDYEVVENQIDELAAAMESEGNWEFTLSEDVINKWIDTDLPKTLPRAVPFYLRDPRVAIEDGFCRMAGEYHNGNVTLVLSMCAEPFLTKKPNEIGIRMSNSRIGAVPGLISQAATQVHWATRRGGMMIKWQDRESSTPQAVITLPRRLFAAKGKKIMIDDVTMLDGHIQITGSTKIVPVPKRKQLTAEQRAKMAKRARDARIARAKSAKQPWPDDLKKIYIERASALGRLIGELY